MVQALHGDGGVKTVFPKGHIEIGALEQGQVLFGELFPQPGEHPLGQVDAGDLGGGAQGEVEFQLQAGAAAQVQELAALFGRQGLAVKAYSSLAFATSPSMCWSYRSSLASKKALISSKRSSRSSIRFPFCISWKARAPGRLGSGPVRWFLSLPGVYVALDGPETLFADDVLDAAGVLRGHLLVHTQGDQPLGEQQVPLVDPLGDLPPLGGSGR